VKMSGFVGIVFLSDGFHRVCSKVSLVNLIIRHNLGLCYIFGDVFLLYKNLYSIDIML